MPNAQDLAAKAPASSSAGNDPTPHPALLKQPLLGKSASPDSPAHSSPRHQQQQQADQAMAPNQSQLTKAMAGMSDEQLTKAEADLTARLQHMQSMVRSGGNPSQPGRPKQPTRTPEPAPSPKHSPSHESDADTEMDDGASHSHGSPESTHRVSQSPRASAAETAGRSQAADFKSKAVNLTANLDEHTANMSDVRPNSAQMHREGSLKPRPGNDAAFRDRTSSHLDGSNAQSSARDVHSRVKQEGSAFADHKADAGTYSTAHRLQKSPLGDDHMQSR